MAENYYHVVTLPAKGRAGNLPGLPADAAAAGRAVAGDRPTIGLPETSFVWDDGDMTAIRWFYPGA